jgi:hypothetical protein
MVNCGRWRHSELPTLSPASAVSSPAHSAPIIDRLLDVRALLTQQLGRGHRWLALGELV